MIVISYLEQFQLVHRNICNAVPACCKRFASRVNSKYCINALARCCIDWISHKALVFLTLKSYPVTSVMSIYITSILKLGGRGQVYRILYVKCDVVESPDKNLLPCGSCVYYLLKRMNVHVLHLLNSIFVNMWWQKKPEENMIIEIKMNYLAAIWRVAVKSFIDSVANMSFFLSMYFSFTHQKSIQICMFKK